jgi:hypothetical protein
MNAVSQAADDRELADIATMCSGPVQYMSANNMRYLYMGGLGFWVKGAHTKMDALLCLNYTNPTYPTRLYLPNSLGLGLNWHESAYLFARQWHSWSWSGVRANQPLIAILAEHLRAFL